MAPSPAVRGNLTEAEYPPIIGPFQSPNWATLGPPKRNRLLGPALSSWCLSKELEENEENWQEMGKLQSLELRPIFTSCHLKLTLKVLTSFLPQPFRGIQPPRWFAANKSHWRLHRILPINAAAKDANKKISSNARSESIPSWHNLQMMPWSMLLFTYLITWAISLIRGVSRAVESPVAHQRLGNAHSSRFTL